MVTIVIWIIHYSNILPAPHCGKLNFQEIHIRKPRTLTKIFSFNDDELIDYLCLSAVLRDDLISEQKEMAKVKLSRVGNEEEGKSVVLEVAHFSFTRKCLKIAKMSSVITKFSGGD